MEQTPSDDPSRVIQLSPLPEDPEMLRFMMNRLDLTGRGFVYSDWETAFAVLWAIHGVEWCTLVMTAGGQRNPGEGMLPAFANRVDKNHFLCPFKEGTNTALLALQKDFDKRIYAYSLSEMPDGTQRRDRDQDSGAKRTESEKGTCPDPQKNLNEDWVDTRVNTRDGAAGGNGKWVDMKSNY